MKFPLASLCVQYSNLQEDLFPQTFFLPVLFPWNNGVPHSTSTCLKEGDNGFLNFLAGDTRWVLWATTSVKTSEKTLSGHRILEISFWSQDGCYWQLCIFSSGRNLKAAVKIVKSNLHAHMWHVHFFFLKIDPIWTKKLLPQKLWYKYILIMMAENKIFFYLA